MNEFNKDLPEPAQISTINIGKEVRMRGMLTRFQEVR